MKIRKSSNCEFYSHTTPSFCKHCDHMGTLVPNFTTCNDWVDDMRDSDRDALHKLLEPILTSVVNTNTVSELSDYIISEGFCKRTTAHWKYHECVPSYDGAKSGYSCSNCNAFIDEDVFESYEFHSDFCGNCGAEMRGRP